MATDPTTIPSVEDLQETKKSMTDIDTFVESNNESFSDKNGQTRKTLTGIENQADNLLDNFDTESSQALTTFDEQAAGSITRNEDRFGKAIAEIGFVRVGNFNDGFTITESNQIAQWQTSNGGDDSWYRWDGPFDKVVNAGSTPLTTGGIGAGKWFVINETVNDIKRPDPRNNVRQMSDGWGAGIAGYNVKDSVEREYDLSALAGVDLNIGVIGEAYNGATPADGKIWLVPQDCAYFVRLDPVANNVQLVDASEYVYVSDGVTARDKFNGAISDGENTWFIPSWTGSLVKINNETLLKTNINLNVYGDDAYNGGIFTGKHVWAVTHDANDLPRVNVKTNVVERFPMTNASTGVDISEGDASFLGGSFDGNNTIWLHPRKSKYLIEVNATTGAVIGSYRHPMADNPPSFGYFHGATYDGKIIWFSSYTSNRICWFNTETKTWSSELHGMSGGTQFNLGGSFDGRFIRFQSFRASELMIVDTFTEKWFLTDLPDELNYNINGGVLYTTGVHLDGYAYSCPSLGHKVARVELLDVESTKHTKKQQSCGGTFLANTKGDTETNYVELNKNGVLSRLDVEGADLDLSTDYLNFNQSGQILVLPDVNMNPSSGLTLLFKLRMDAFNANGRLFTNGESFNQTGRIDINRTALDNSIALGVSGNFRRYTMSKNAEHTLAFVLDGTGVTCYIDGVLQSEPTGGATSGTPVPLPDTLINDAYVGNIINGGALDRPLTGGVQQFAMFSSQLNSTQINDWHNSGEIPSINPLARFDINERFKGSAVILGEDVVDSKMIMSTKTGVYVMTKGILGWTSPFKISN